jgi:hypothetical protein
MWIMPMNIVFMFTSIIVILGVLIGWDNAAFGGAIASSSALLTAARRRNIFL